MRLLQELKRRRLFVVKDGHPLAVLRPRDPELAWELATQCIGKSYSEAERPFQEILTKQPYQFLGFAGTRRPNGAGFSIVDDNGSFLEELKQGDSFVTAAWSGSGKELRPVTTGLQKIEYVQTKNSPLTENPA